VNSNYMSNAARKAALAVGNSSSEIAALWVMDHMGEPSLDDPPVEAQAPVAGGPMFSPEQYAAVEAMGFPREVCHLALKRAKGNTERAAEWILSNMDDLDRLVAVDAAESSADASSSGGGAAAVAAAPQADPGCKNGQYRLFAMVSHLGKNTSSGHYVAHIMKDGQWLLFNDEKVANSIKPPTQFAYAYFYRRVD